MAPSQSHQTPLLLDPIFSRQWDPVSVTQNHKLFGGTMVLVIQSFSYSLVHSFTPHYIWGFPLLIWWVQAECCSVHSHRSRACQIPEALLPGLPRPWHLHVPGASLHFALSALGEAWVCPMPVSPLGVELLLLNVWGKWLLKWFGCKATNFLDSKIYLLFSYFKNNSYCMVGVWEDEHFVFYGGMINCYRLDGVYSKGLRNI